MDDVQAGDGPVIKNQQRATARLLREKEPLRPKSQQLIRGPGVIHRAHGDSTVSGGWAWNANDMFSAPDTTLGRATNPKVIRHSGRPTTSAHPAHHLLGVHRGLQCLRTSLLSSENVEVRLGRPLVRVWAMGACAVGAVVRRIIESHNGDLEMGGWWEHDNLKS